MKINNNIWFWVLQCLGWGTLASYNSLFKLVKAPSLDKSYIILEGLLFVTVTIFCSSLFYSYLKKKVDFVNINSKQILKICISFLLTVVLISALLVLFAKVLYNAFHETELIINSAIIISNFVITFIYLFFWLACYRIIKMTRRFRKNKEERLVLENTLKESELNTLKSQINPHFMFNSLNNIRGLMLEDVEKSRDMITRLSEMLRYSLTQNKVDTIPLNEELEMVSNYIELSKIQFENRLTFTSNIDDTLLSINIPPMIIQMLIENAIKHGISNIREGGKINLSVSEFQKQLIINVSNSGTLTKKESSTKVGLENIKKRLALLYKNEASFTLKEKDNLVTASIKLPI